jgi:hypothetical protein
MKITPSLGTRGDPRLARIVLHYLSLTALGVASDRLGTSVDLGRAVETGESGHGGLSSYTPGRRAARGREDGAS